MVTLTHPATDVTRATPRAVASSHRPLGGSVMLMGVGGRFALVAGGIVAVWTTIALALS